MRSLQEGENPRIVEKIFTRHESEELFEDLRWRVTVWLKREGISVDDLDGFVADATIRLVMMEDENRRPAEATTCFDHVLDEDGPEFLEAPPSLKLRDVCFMSERYDLDPMPRLRRNAEIWFRNSVEPKLRGPRRKKEKYRVPRRLREAY